MKVVRNHIRWLPIPCIGYKACLCFKWLIVRGDARLSDRFMNHEYIHVVQMKETLYIFFYLWYGVEWFIKFIAYGLKAHKAYRNVLFEKEAYSNEKDLRYLDNRKRFAWTKYLKQ